MIQQFPEIDAFFAQDHFSAEALQALRVDLAKTYDSKRLKQAETQIKLELLRFQLATAEGVDPKKALPATIQRAKKSKKSLPKLQQSTIKHSGSGKSEVANIHHFMGLTFAEINAQLDWPAGKIEALAKSKNLAIEPSGILTFETDAIIHEILGNRYSLLKRQKKLEKNPIKPNRAGVSAKGDSASTGIHVYDKLEAAGGVGKLIYIRMK
jgi:hypothetical protein